ncbi:MAG: hypothetical protein KKC37_02615 [Proteobacteria bacterium]|nr:hypothetical protein [Pseudomonadota bacterium]
MQDKPQENDQRTGNHQELLANLSTVLVEIFGGIVQNVEASDQILHPVRVVVRDHDNLRVDPESTDDEWILDPNTPNESYVAGFKDGFIAGLRDENLGPGQVWTDEEQAELFKEIDRWFG